MIADRAREARDLFEAYFIDRRRDGPYNRSVCCKTKTATVSTGYLRKFEATLKDGLYSLDIDLHGVLGRIVRHKYCLEVSCKIDDVPCTISLLEEEPSKFDVHVIVDMA